MIKKMMKKRNKGMRMKGSQGVERESGKMGINKIGEGWWERERGAGGGDQAGEGVGVVVEVVEV